MSVSIPTSCIAASADDPEGDAHYLREQILHSMPEKGQGATALDRMHFVTEPVPKGWLCRLLEAWTSPRKVVHTAGGICTRGDTLLSQQSVGGCVSPHVKRLCWLSMIVPCSRFPSI